MKRLTVVLAAVLFLAIISESVYGKPGKGKSGDRGRSEKSERDNNRGGEDRSDRNSSKGKSEKSEVSEKEKNQKSLDAQRNWGHLKKELDINGDGEYTEDEVKDFFGISEYDLDYDPDKVYSNKEIKEAIKVEKVVRRELRKYEESLPDLPDEAKGDDFFEDWVDYYIGNPDQAGCDLEGEVDEESLSRMYSAVEKYCATLERLGEEKEYPEYNVDNENGEGEGTEVSVLPENIE